MPTVSRGTAGKHVHFLTCGLRSAARQRLWPSSWPPLWCPAPAHPSAATVCSMDLQDRRFTWKAGFTPSSSFGPSLATPPCRRLCQEQLLQLLHQPECGCGGAEQWRRQLLLHQRAVQHHWRPLHHLPDPRHSACARGQQQLCDVSVDGDGGCAGRFYSQTLCMCGEGWLLRVPGRACDCPEYTSCCCCLMCSTASRMCAPAANHTGAA